MTAFFGDFDTSETVYIPFNTFDSNDPSASVTATTLLNTDVHLHKDGAVAQRGGASAGITVSIDFDGIAGNHMVAIDLSDNSDAGWYANGTQVSVRVEGMTVDGALINAWIGAFTIGRMLRPTTAGRTLDILSTGEAAANLTMMGGVAQSATDLKDFADAGYDPATNKVQGVVLVDTTTTLTGHTAQTGDSFARLGAPVGASIAADIATVDTVVDAIKVITDALPDSGGLSSLAQGAALTTVDGVVDAIKVVTDALTAAGAANLALSAAGIVGAAVNGGTPTTTTFIADGFTEDTDDHFIGRTIIFTSGNLANQATDITDYTGSTQTFTVTALTEPPVDNDTFVIV